MVWLVPVVQNFWRRSSEFVQEQKENIVYDGKMLNFSSPKDAMDHGFALITEERKANGLFLKGDITFNTTIANMNHYKSGIALST